MLAPTPYFADRGCHVRIFEEARALIRQGHAVRIVTYHLGRDLPPVPVDRIPAVPWYRKLAAGPSWHKPYLDLLLLAKALRVARSFRPDLLHAHLHEGGFLGLLLKRILGVPLLFDCQGSMTTEMLDHGFFRAGSLLHRGFGFLEGVINRGADFILTSSGPGAADLVERWGVPAAKVRALIDGVDTDEFRPGDRAAARQELGLPLDVPVAVFLGVLNRYQGVDLLLEVVDLLRQRQVPLHFLVMGFPEEEYRRRAAEMGLAERITFTGRVDYGRTPHLLAAGDLALSPKISRTEANGKLFNYMACGLPTVAFDAPINREILGDAGVYARFGDAGDFADRLVELAADLPCRQELARRVREKAVAEHSWTAREKVLEDLYFRLLESASALGRC